MSMQSKVSGDAHTHLARIKSAAAGFASRETIFSLREHVKLCVTRFRQKTVQKKTRSAATQPTSSIGNVAARQPALQLCCQIANPLAHARACRSTYYLLHLTQVAPVAPTAAKHMALSGKTPLLPKNTSARDPTTRYSELCVLFYSSWQVNPGLRLAPCGALQFQQRVSTGF